MRHEPEPKPMRRVVVYSRTAHEAFGRLEETGEQVYIPCRVAFASDLKPDTTVLAAVVPNTAGVNRTPWFATYVNPR